ncbi:hypothetical protein TsFJ059_002415 [Trichoderma semiorbis]|uniref:CHK kinase-like domain-containing protein n=1 Tax=Trichoderma semiorbis TaxID=1491008 RepID=A0A9P8HJ89_9HYPO|nr:hypothetical protein TsFJ059_002415 [Trichoderma semiorbis]
MSETEQKLPLAPEEISSDWLSSVLGQKVKSFVFTNQILLATASKLFVTITYDDAAAASAAGKPTTICLKGGFNQAVVAQYPDIMIRIYTREVGFFTWVAPRLSHVDMLKCWWSGSNSEQGIVILDDLNQQGGTFGEPTETWTVDQVKAGVEQLAGLHAGTWGDKSSDLPGWLTDPEHYDSTILSLCSWWQGLVVGESRPHFPSNWNEERITAAMKKHLKSRDPKFTCLLHGDPHAGNTYFINGQPRFLDWQLIHVGSAFHDVAYFAVGALTVKDRKEHEMSILQHYLDSLAKFGGPTFVLDDVLVEYRKSLLSGIGWMLTPYKLQTKERVHAMSERYGSAIVDHKAIELVESL